MENLRTPGLLNGRFPQDPFQVTIRESFYCFRHTMWHRQSTVTNGTEIVTRNSCYKTSHPSSILMRHVNKAYTATTATTTTTTATTTTATTATTTTTTATTTTAATTAATTTTTTTTTTTATTTTANTT